MTSLCRWFLAPGSLRNHSPRGKVRPAVEELEARTLLSTATLRIVTYNMEDDIDGYTTPRSGFYQVLEGIGEEQVQGHVLPPTIIALQETTSNSTTVAPIVSNLNSYYSGIATYAQSPYQATQDGSNSDGNGPNALVYNSSVLTLLASVGVGTPEGSTNGEYRQVVRYEFQPVGASGGTGIFYLYICHAKSGTTSEDATDRNEEAQIIRNDEATLPASACVLYTGDFNLDSSSDASYQTMTAAMSPGGVAQGVGYDPLNQPGDWDTNSTFQGIMTESATDLRYRDDFEFVTQNVLDATAGGLGYVSGSYHTFGNNGTTPVEGSINSGSDTALNSDLVQDGPTFISASQLYGYLTTASDHLPVVADYTDPITLASTTTVTSSVNPSNYGQSVALTATVTGSGGTPTGSVTFMDGSNTLGSANLSSGVATFPISTLIVGSHSITANYGGNSIYTSSTSSPLSQVVNALSTTTTLTDNGPNPSTVGQAVNFVVTVAPTVPDGETVTLEDAGNGNVQVGSGTLTSGTVTITVSNLSAGTHNIFAVYGGDANYEGNQSSQVAQVINSASTPISITSININAGTDPIISASESNNTVTITTDGPCGFAVGDPVVIAGVGSGAFNGTFTVLSVGTNSFTYSNSTSGLPTVTNAGTATDTGQTGGLLVNGVAGSGHTASYNSQRSMVDTIVYKFNQAVSLGASAFTITVLGQGGQAPTVSYVSPDGGFTWVVTFSGTGVTGNSIANGEYQIVLNNSAVLAVTGGGTLASNDTESFYRLFGDTVGNGHDRVNNTDNLVYLGAFGSRSTQNNFLAYLDYNDDGRINNADNLTYLSAFGVRYLGFAATI